MLTALAEFRTGMVNGVKVNVGRLQNLVSSSCLEHLDFLQLDQQKGYDAMADLDVRRFRQLQHELIQNYSRLTEIPQLKRIQEEKGTFLASQAKINSFTYSKRFFERRLV
jgi:phosphorylase kinase alpha/beta subunit